MQMEFRTSQTQIICRQCGKPKAERERSAGSVDGVKRTAAEWLAHTPNRGSLSRDHRMHSYRPGLKARSATGRSAYTSDDPLDGTPSPSPSGGKHGGAPLRK